MKTLTIQISDELHRLLKTAAAQAGTTQRDIIIKLINKYLEEK